MESYSKEPPFAKDELTVQERPAASLENGVVDSDSERLGHGELEVLRIRDGNSVLRKLRGFEEWLDKKLKVEGMGAERIPESKRKPPRTANVRSSFHLDKE